MEEEKIQRLHDTLSKLRRGHGLGTSSHFNFGGGADGIATKKDADGNVIRKDGLPMNGLYSNFIREGTGYDPKKAVERKYGDGRVIKRNFDDCKGDDSSSDSDSDSDSSSDSSNSSSGAPKKKRKKKMNHSSSSSSSSSSDPSPPQSPPGWPPPKRKAKKTKLPQGAPLPKWKKKVNRSST